MIMALCLLVYNLGQRQVRKALVETAQTIPNQLGKPTDTPTLRWVFLKMDKMIESLSVRQERLEALCAHLPILTALY
jgi:transposase